MRVSNEFSIEPLRRWCPAVSFGFGLGEQDRVEPKSGVAV
jgi:hypothetical protein